MRPSGWKHSEETKAKISVGMKGKPSPNKGVVMSEDQKRKISAARKGQHNGLGTHRQPWSPSTIAKQSAAHKGQIVSLESRAKISASRLGFKASPETRAKDSVAKKKNGNTPVNKLIRHSVEYITWRTAVFERDNYTCQDCGKRGVFLEAHHIHAFAEYPEERFVVDNGKTLCLECHNKTKRRKAHVIEVIP